MEWKEIEKTLNGKLKKAEFIIALSPIQIYKAAKKLKEMGLTEKERSVMNDYNKLVKKGIYEIVETRIEGGREKKFVRINVSNLCQAFAKEIGLEDPKHIRLLCESLTFQTDKKEESEPIVDINEEELKELLDVIDITTLTSIITLYKLHDIKDPEKEHVQTIIFKFLFNRFMNKPALLVSYFQASWKYRNRISPVTPQITKILMDFMNVFPKLE